MKKTKVKSFSCVMLLVLLMLSMGLEVHAREDVKQIDGSYLTDEDESIGYATPITRGDDLMAGYSKCVRLANGNLYVGGSTLAAHPVDRIGIAVIVDRAKKRIQNGRHTTVGLCGKRMRSGYHLLKN